MDVTDSKTSDGASPSGRQQYINRMSFTMPSPLLQSPKSGLMPSKSKLPLMFFSLVIGVGIALSQLWSGSWRSIDSGVLTSPNIASTGENYDSIKNHLRATFSPWENRSTPTIFDMPARDQFVGAWVLKSYHIDDASTGARHYPLGQDAIGLILYTPDGHMSATLSKSKPTMFAETANMADVMKPGYPETDKMLQRWTDYISYSGTYDVDVEGQHVLHHVYVSMFPNSAGGDQVRVFKFGKEEKTGTDTLQLAASFPPQNHVLLWKRAEEAPTEEEPAKEDRR